MKLSDVDRQVQLQQEEEEEQVVDNVAPTDIMPMNMTTAPSSSSAPSSSFAPSDSANPTEQPTLAPVEPEPTPGPTMVPTNSPTSTPTPEPTVATTKSPTPNPTPEPTEGGLRIGDDICIEGFIMDWFCIDRGVLLDNSRVRTLEGPDVHSIHCLVDVGICVNSAFEVLVEPLVYNAEEDAMEYQRGWRISEDVDEYAGKQMVIDLARDIGTRCSTCTGNGDLSEGFRAALRVKLLDFAASDGTPATVQVLEVGASHDMADPCQTFFNMPLQEIL